MAQYLNSFYVTRDGETLATLGTAASYDVFTTGDVVLTETVNKSTVYFPGDTINFTLTITNNLTSAIDLVDIVDTIDSSVDISTYQINSGTAVDCDNSVEILDFNLPHGDTVITINGEIPSI